MAKRVVVFDIKESPSVKIRKNKANKNAAPKTVPAPQKTKIKKVQSDCKTVFRDKLLADMRRALDNAHQLMENENDPDRFYYAEKSAFLENAIKALNSEESSFTPLSEPFFWNEFKRIGAIINEGRKAGDKAPIAWRKAGNKCAAKLLESMNRLRAERDGWIVNTAPVIVRSLVFFINGAMLYLDLQIKENPEREDLRQLRQMYSQVYAKSGLKKEGAKLAYVIRKKNLRKIWKNQETVDYLLKNHPEPERADSV